MDNVDQAGPSQGGMTVPRETESSLHIPSQLRRTVPRETESPHGSMESTSLQYHHLPWAHQRTGCHHPKWWHHLICRSSHALGFAYTRITLSNCPLTTNSCFLSTGTMAWHKDTGTMAHAVWHRHGGTCTMAQARWHRHGGTGVILHHRECHRQQAISHKREIHSWTSQMEIHILKIPSIIIEKCKIKNRKGLPLRWVKMWVNHLGVGPRRFSQNIYQTNRNLQDWYPVFKIPSIINWNRKMKNLQGIPHQKGSDTGISLDFGLHVGLMSTKRKLSLHAHTLHQGLYPSHAYPRKHSGDTTCTSWLRLAIATSSSTWFGFSKGGSSNIHIGESVSMEQSSPY